MTMPIKAASDGFSAFVAIGMKWPGRPSGREGGDVSLSHGQAMPDSVIDVDAQPQESSDSSYPLSSSPDQSTLKSFPPPRGYALPNGPSQAPRLLYCAPFPGQMIDTYA